MQISNSAEKIKPLQENELNINKSAQISPNNLEIMRNAIKRGS
jgi:hypothetical protein